jgi:hypothetical protein
MASFVTVRAPSWTDGVQVNGQDMRLGITTLLNSPNGEIYGRAGVRPGNNNGLKVVQNTSPDMHVLVKAGMGIIQSTTSLSVDSGGMYPIVLTTDAVLDVATAPGSPNSRRDRVVAQIVDVGTASTTYQIRVITGTPGTSPVVPTLPDDALDLGQYLVGTSVTSILNANITDSRVYTTALGGIIPCPSSNRPTNPYEGMVTWSTDSNVLAAYSAGAWGFVAYGRINGGNVRYHRTTTLNLLSLDMTTVPFNGASPDTDVDVTASGTGNQIFTMQRAGKWFWSCCLPFQTNANGSGRWLVMHKGSDSNTRYAVSNNPNAGAGAGNCHLNASFVRRFAIGDTLSVSAYQDSGNTIPLDPNAATGPCVLYGQYLGS